MKEIITKDEYKDMVYDVLVTECYKDLIYSVNASIKRTIKKGFLYGGVTVGWRIDTDTRSIEDAKKEIKFVFSKSGWECSFEGETTPESELIYFKVLFDVR